MNVVILTGRLTVDPELKYTQQGTACTSFNLAVDRASKNDETDFPTIVAWRETAEFASKYLHKGQQDCCQRRNPHTQLRRQGRQQSQGNRRYRRIGWNLRTASRKARSHKGGSNEQRQRRIYREAIRRAEKRHDNNSVFRLQAFGGGEQEAAPACRKALNERRGGERP